MLRRRATPGPSLEAAIRAATTRGPGARSHSEIVPPSGRHLVIPAASGVITAIDRDALIALADRFDVVIAEERAPGDYAVAGTPLLSWWSSNEFIPTVADEQTLDRAALAAVSLGGRAADVATLLRETGLDDLSVGLCLLARLPDPPRAHMDEAGFWRLLTAERDFAATLEASLRPRVAQAADAAVAERLLLLLREVAFAATLPARRQCALRERDRLLRALAAHPFDAEQRQRFDMLAEHVDDAVEGRWSVRK
ncbi:DUF2254 domain-containing protein [Microbacteriaceae bacterium VKM Ac-2855]|nr:DUF2254 domain-containing protein [Microbacteriaceae bacterium VKM Ac-2855]